MSSGHAASQGTANEHQILALLLCASGTDCHCRCRTPLLEQRANLARRNEEARSNYVNYVLADGLRQSSEDLTRMVRLYAITGDPVYKDYFDQILAIRNGEQARPDQYFQIPYRDLVLATGEHQGEAGEAVPIRELIAGSDASRLEVTLLAEAEDWSNVLVELENEVMDVVAAQIEAGDGSYQLEGEALTAMQRLHGADYHIARERIMRRWSCFRSLPRTKNRRWMSWAPPGKQAVLYLG